MFLFGFERCHGSCCNSCRFLMAFFRTIQKRTKGCEFSRKSSFSKLRTIQKQTNHLAFASWHETDRGSQLYFRFVHDNFFMCLQTVWKKKKSQLNLWIQIGVTSYGFTRADIKEMMSRRSYWFNDFETLFHVKLEEEQHRRRRRQRVTYALTHV